MGSEWGFSLLPAQMGRGSEGFLGQRLFEGNLLLRSEPRVCRRCPGTPASTQTGALAGSIQGEGPGEAEGGQSLSWHEWQQLFPRASLTRRSPCPFLGQTVPAFPVPCSEMVSRPGMPIQAVICCKGD